jgi:hypothetical protein
MSLEKEFESLKARLDTKTKTIAVLMHAIRVLVSQRDFLLDHGAGDDVSRQQRKEAMQGEVQAILRQKIDKWE